MQNAKAEKEKSLKISEHNWDRGSQADIASFCSCVKPRKLGHIMIALILFLIKIIKKSSFSIQSLQTAC